MYALIDHPFLSDDEARSWLISEKFNPSPLLDRPFQTREVGTLTIDYLNANGWKIEEID